MERIKKSLSNLPKWFFTIITLVGILWLTLAPKPLGEEPPPLFPGADKIGHALMFGFFTAMLAFDRQRKNRWHKVGWKRMFTYAFASSALGAFIEVLQWAMGMGRSFEVEDIVADSAGSFLMAAVWIFESGRRKR